MERQPFVPPAQVRSGKVPIDAADTCLAEGGDFLEYRVGPLGRRVVRVDQYREAGFVIGLHGVLSVALGALGWRLTTVGRKA